MRYNLKICEIEYYKEFFVSSELLYIKYAGLLLNGKFTIGCDVFDTFNYNIKNLSDFNWQYVPANASNTYELYIYGLRHIYILCKAYEMDKNIEYIKLAVNFFNSYCSFVKKDILFSTMLDNDHAISERIENVTYLAYVCIKESLPIIEVNILNEFVDNEVKKLETDVLYQKNHNHGIIADKAVLIGLNFFKLDSYLERTQMVIKRLNKQINHALFRDGVHKENSFDYHLAIMRLFIGISEVLKLINNNYYSEVIEKINMMKEYLLYAYKPDLSKPLFGDSKGVATYLGGNKNKIINPGFNIETYNDVYLEYINSKGTKGKTPQQLIKYFPNSGYVFYRSHFNKENFDNASWFSFKAGFETRIHKHKDDLSLCWYSNKYDILVDSGMYTFMYGEFYKNYMESVEAHSVPGILNCTYSIARNNGERAKIVNVKDYDDYFYILGFSKLYQDVNIYRHIYYIKSMDVLIVRDQFFSKKKKKFIQYFNLSPYIFLDDDKKLNLIGSNMYLNFLDVDSGVITNLKESYFSTGFGIFESKLTVIKSKSMRNGSITTAMGIATPESNNLSTLKINKNGFFLNKSFISYEELSPLFFTPPIVNYKEGVIIIKKNKNIKEHALYIYNYKNGGIIKKIHFTSDNIVYENTNRHELILLYYIFDNNDVRDKGIIGCIKRKNGGGLKLYKNKRSFFPKVNSISFKRIKPNREEYLFSVNIEYIFRERSLYTWWVYYNGSCIKYLSNNKSYFKYKMEKAGEYVIIVSVSDFIFGEFYYENFEKIKVN